MCAAVAKLVVPVAVARQLIVSPRRDRLVDEWFADCYVAAHCSQRRPVVWGETSCVLVCCSDKQTRVAE